jgi:hypothetical protein
MAVMFPEFNIELLRSGHEVCENYEIVRDVVEIVCKSRFYGIVCRFVLLLYEELVLNVEDLR